MALVEAPKIVVGIDFLMLSQIEPRWSPLMQVITGMVLVSHCLTLVLFDWDFIFFYRLAYFSSDIHIKYEPLPILFMFSPR